jgi:uroporphyrinogen decarboxylase
VFEQADGVRVLRRKTLGSIPQHLRHALTNRASWNKLFKPRLDPSHPDRLPPHLDDCVKRWGDPNRKHPLFLPCGSLYGRLRSWMGLEQVSLAVHRDPAWFEEMVTTVADCVYGTLERVLATGVQFDGAQFWEDMCYNSGPLLSPRHVRQYLVPHYRRITDLLRRHGVDTIWVDSDGNVESLIPLWLEAGINGVIPIEIGTTGQDPVAMRRRFGRELLMFGGFDKRILARSHADIEREVHRLTPLVEEGGYIACCDHSVPPDVALDNYLYYLRRVRRAWGRETNLPPLHAGE